MRKLPLTEWHCVQGQLLFAAFLRETVTEQSSVQAGKNLKE